MIQKNGRIPSPRNPAVYKTNLTNRHEKILMSFAKIIIYYPMANFIKEFQSF